MFLNLLKTAIRSLRRRGAHSLITISGLTVGIACLFLLYTYVRFEMSWDRFHSATDHAYRINTTITREGNDSWESTGSSSILVDNINGKIPGLKTIARYDDHESLIRLENNTMLQSKILFFDSDLFKILDFNDWYDKPLQINMNQNEAVLTETEAERLFGSVDPVGKTFEALLNGEMTPLQVTGVIRDLPANSSVQGDILLSYELYERTLLTQWSNISLGTMTLTTLALLEPDVSPQEVVGRIDETVNSLGLNSNERYSFSFQLQPITTMHININPAAKDPEIWNETDSTAMLVLLAIGLAILVIAAINVATLTVGQAPVRTKEIGVRKVLGAQHSQLMCQFWVESAALVGMSLLLGFGLAMALQPSFQNLSELPATIPFDLMTVFIAIAFWIVITLISGFYPALVMAAFPSSEALRGSVKVADRSRVRRGLVLIQFALSVGLLSITLLMSSQVKYLLNRDLGFTADQVVSFSLAEGSADLDAAQQRFRNLFDADPGVEMISGSSCVFGEGFIRLFIDSEETGENWILGLNTVDPEFITMLDIELLEGRNFDPAVPSDAQRAVIVNETLVNDLEWSNPIGKAIPGMASNEVIGVVRDFNFSSLHRKIEPIALVLDAGFIFSQRVSVAMNNGPEKYFIFAKLKSDGLQQTMRRIEQAWPDIAPQVTYNYSFLDENIEKQYREEKRWSTILGWASVIALFIALSGMLGLAVMQVTQRTREIGIRKVLGATSTQLSGLLTREFAILVVVSWVIAYPVAYYVCTRWLEQFAYRAAMPWWVFGVAGVLILVMAVLVTGALAWKASIANPVQSLRQE